jgi:predicted Zn-dependent protease
VRDHGRSRPVRALGRSPAIAPRASEMQSHRMKWPEAVPTTVLGLLLAPPPSVSAIQQTSDRQVVILSPDEGDRRLALTREAIAFWNQTFSDLKLRPRLVEADVIVASPVTRALETFARRISMRAEGLAPLGAGPSAPRELTHLRGDIVVFLSGQDIFSVTRAFAQRFFIVIQTDRAPPLNSPNVARNVIAHELGHALGLAHNSDPTTLMCGPCQPLVSGSEERVFSPLTSDDRARLLELYPSR